MSEEVIELSVDETNRLRAELGLAPLRSSKNENAYEMEASAPNANANNGGLGDEEMLEMSVDDSNSLREKLGLAPLRASGSKKPDVHKPAENDWKAKEAAERIEQARLKREVEAGVTKSFGSSTLAEQADNSALSWAEQMRRNKAVPKKSKVRKQKVKNEPAGDYDEKDLEGVQVAHSMNDLEAGSTTVLTLADAPLLSQSLDENTSKKKVGLNDGDFSLENVNLTESKKQQDGLRKKRMLEMGMGRAGGYAGFDDEEFEELGGTLGPSKRQRGNAVLEGDMEEGGNKPRGFRIGSTRDTDKDSSVTDFDKIQKGEAVSLLPAKADLASSDYMTLEEEETERALRKKNKDGKFKKKKKKKDKKRRKTVVDSDEEDEDEGMLDRTNENGANGTRSNLLDQLEESDVPASSGLRKRRRTDNDEEAEAPSAVDDAFVAVKQEEGQPATAKNEDKRSKYEEIMAKGNERTQKAFMEKAKTKRKEESFLDEEPDDSFLNAALAKARRLNRLRDMNKYTSRGANAVADAVKSSMSKETTSAQNGGGESSSGVMFTIDDTREFTLALQTRSQQKEREMEKAKQQRSTAKSNQVVKKEEDAPNDFESKKEEMTVETAIEEEDDDVDMAELANDVNTDDLDDTGFDGSTARNAGVGRGLSSFVSMLKTTGEISSKNVKEELRGRAKDERNYEVYAPMDLSKVVNVGRNANDKDREFANREVKLEYRDKHGRLLTTKEAYRDLCYQFHGHGASKKKEEKRLKQIEREQAQARMASRQVAAARDGTTGGSLGALKATQKATGKAFIVHKT